MLKAACAARLQMALLIPSPDTVASMLAEPATRIATLDALERHEGPHETALALATAPALSDLMCLDGGSLPHELYQRVGLLRGRLMVEAEDLVAIYGAFICDGRYARVLTAPSVGQGEIRAKSAAQLNRDDALSYACGMWLAFGLSSAAGWTRTLAAGGFSSAKEWLAIFMAEEPIASAQHCPDDDKAIRMLRLLVELLRSGEVPDLVTSGALNAANGCIQSRPAVAGVALELGVMELVSAQLSRSGAPHDWLSTTHSKTARGILTSGLTGAVGQILSGFAGSTARPDLDALVSSGLLDQTLAALGAFEQAGVEGLATTDIGGMYGVLTVLKKSISHSTCNARIRSAASAIAFAMEHSLDFSEEFGMTTGSSAAALCEYRSEFSLCLQCI